MKLTKDSQRAWDKLKRKGYTDKEIAEDHIFQMEYESEEERIESENELKEAIKKIREQNEKE